MTEPTPPRIEALFFDAVELPTDQRASFLDLKCQNDSELRRQVETLLAADPAAGGADFLEVDFLDARPDANIDEHSSATPNGRTDDVAREGHRFRILSQHREGGLGEVLIAYDLQLNRDVAIKQIKPKWQSHEEAKHRFAQEAEVTGRLEHPGVVPVYAMGTWEDGRQNYAMRLATGSREALPATSRRRIRVRVAWRSRSTSHWRQVGRDRQVAWDRLGNRPADSIRRCDRLDDDIG
ncbi:MAG: hypothetical protein ACR2NZ_07310 [Rubripirellula sp.]